MAEFIWRLFWPLVFYGLTVDLMSLLFKSKGILFCTMAGAVLSLPFLMTAYGQEAGGKDCWRSFGRKEAAACALKGIGACLLVNTVIRFSGAARLFTGFAQVSPRIYGTPLWIQLLGLCLAIPLAEELVFRGLVFGSVRRDRSFALSAAVSALLFGIYHGNALQGSYGLVMGMLFAWEMEKKQTLLAPVTMHMWANLASVAWTWLQRAG